MLNTILLQTDAPQGGGMSMIILMVAFFAIIYFLMIRPQNKRQKKIREAREKLQKGDKVITSGGIYGRVREVKDNTLVVEISDGVKITVDKNCIYPANNADDAVQDAQMKNQQ